MIKSRIEGLDLRDHYVAYFSDYIANLRRYNELRLAMLESQEEDKSDLEREMSWATHAVSKSLTAMDAALEYLTCEKP